MPVKLSVIALEIPVNDVVIDSDIPEKLVVIAVLMPVKLSVIALEIPLNDSVTVSETFCKIPPRFRPSPSIFVPVSLVSVTVFSVESAVSFVLFFMSSSFSFISFSIS